MNHDFTNQIKFENALKVGDKVTVRWGYGLSFRAEGQGTITKIFNGSFQVTLTAPVPSPTRIGGQGWPEGFTLKGIPRLSYSNLKRWNYWNCVAAPKGE